MHCIDTLITHLSVDGHFGCFCFGTIMNNAAIKHSQISLYVAVCLHSLRYMPKRGIVGSYGNSMLNFLRNHQAVIHYHCIILHSHQQCMRVTVSPQPFQLLLWSVFLISSHASGCEVTSRSFYLHFSTGYWCWPFLLIFKLGYLFIFCFYLKIFFIFRERGRREGEREGEKHQCAGETLIGCLLHAPSWGPGPQPRNWTCNLSVRRMTLNPLHHTRQDRLFIYFYWLVVRVLYIFWI